MKNISLVTWYYSKNFGTVLQAFALLRFLKQQGYNVSILDEFSLGDGIKPLLKNTLGKIGLFSLAKDILHYKEKKLLRFFHEEMNIQYVFSQTQLNRVLDTTDVFLSGSDQIWNPYYASFSTFFMLDFAKGGKKCAYATSIGTDNFDTKDKDKIRSLLRDYSHISVREDSAVTFINKFTGRNDVCQVLDPTFLLNCNDWKNIGSKAEYGINSLSDNYMLCYLIGNNDWYVKQALSVANAYNIKDVVEIYSAESPEFNYPGAIVLNNMGPREFVGLISNASLVCTDSFHATALSLNMGKDFVEFKRFKDSSKASQNSRIYSVLQHYGLMSKMYSDETDSWKGMYDNKVVSSILDQDRKKSIDFLINSFEK